MFAERSKVRTGKLWYPVVGKLSDRAGIGDLTFDDLRETAVVRLAIAGATVPQIATFTSHSLGMSRLFSMRTILVATFSLRKRRC